MSKLIYIANVSLDGYIEDSHGNFDWTGPNDEVFAFITDLVRSSGTYLYGRRMYETHAADLELLDERRFSSGVVYVRYRVAS